MAKNSLKGALAKHQIKASRKMREKATQAAKEAQAKAKLKPKQKKPTKIALKSGSNNHSNNKKVTIPFEAHDSILLIGEGDFSFARSLISSPLHIDPSNIVATAYDSEPECYAKYAWAEQTVTNLREKGVEVFFNVDATKLESTKKLKNRRFDKVVWNFPHAGKGITDQDRNVLSNQQLLLGFFKSVTPFLIVGEPRSKINRSKPARANGGGNDDSEEDRDDAMSVASSEEESVAQNLRMKPRGTILITLRNKLPYTLWELPTLAKKPPPPFHDNPRYVQVRSFQFHPSAYPGYAHRRTAGHRGEREITVVKDDEDTARTWEFEPV